MGALRSHHRSPVQARAGASGLRARPDEGMAASVRVSGISHPANGRVSTKQGRCHGGAVRSVA